MDKNCKAVYNHIKSFGEHVFDTEESEWDDGWVVVNHFSNLDLDSKAIATAIDKLIASGLIETVIAVSHPKKEPTICFRIIPPKEIISKRNS